MQYAFFCAKIEFNYFVTTRIGTKVQVKMSLNDKIFGDSVLNDKLRAMRCQNIDMSFRNNAYWYLV